MKLRPQVQLRFRDAEQFLAIKDRAAVAALSVNEWILRQVESVGLKWLNSGNPEAGAVESEGSSVDRRPTCPEDGERLVWNKVLKLWECECGYRGK